MPDGNEIDISAEDLLVLHTGLMTDLLRLWMDRRELAKQIGVGPVKFSRVSIVSLSQLAAVIAVDVGLTEEQFLATCKANFAEAAKRAPRWS